MVELIFHMSGTYFVIRIQRIPRGKEGSCSVKPLGPDFSMEESWGIGSRCPRSNYTVEKCRVLRLRKWSGWAEVSYEQHSNHIGEGPKSRPGLKASRRYNRAGKDKPSKGAHDQEKGHVPGQRELEIKCCKDSLNYRPAQHRKFTTEGGDS